MILGHKEGDLWLFENTAGQGQPMNFNLPVQTYQGIDVGNFSTPQLFDLNADGLIDLVIGEENGNLNFYQNTGSIADPVFTFVTDSLGKVNVTDYQFSYTGFSTPCFFKTMQNETRLLVGSEQGKVFYYKNIEGNIADEFEENDSLFLIIDNQPFEIQNGIRTGAAIGDINSDGNFDLLIGNYSGGLNYYSGQNPPPVIGLIDYSEPILKFELFPNPASEQINLNIFGNDPSADFIINIYNILSEKVYSSIQNSSQKITVSLGSLPAGVYICRINLTAGLQIGAGKRFIISQ
jgi:hypothetical protein